MAYADGNLGLGLGEAQNLGKVKPTFDILICCYHPYLLQTSIKICKLRKSYQLKIFK
jgi:hypothetical protein